MINFKSKNGHRERKEKMVLKVMLYQNLKIWI